MLDCEGIKRRLQDFDSQHGGKDRRVLVRAIIPMRFTDFALKPPGRHARLVDRVSMLILPLTPPPSNQAYEAQSRPACLLRSRGASE